MNFLRSAFFNLAFYSYTITVAFTCLPALLFGLRALNVVGRVWAKGSLLLAQWICSIRYEVRGKQYLSQQPAIFASKHQSAWDTLIFWALLDQPVYVLKRELLLLPLFGWYLSRLRSIAIDRKAGSTALKTMLMQAKANLQAGRSVVIFPEGTRTRVGAESVYHPGVASLYSQLGHAVVPVALNSGLYWSRRAFFQKPGTIFISFLPPIAPGLRPRDFMNRLSSVIETESAKLVEEGKKILLY